MNKEAQMWEKINTPKIKGLITIFDKNGEPEGVINIIDTKDIPKKTRQRKKK